MQKYKSNVIILTTGLSGSSLITSLIASAGYWIGKKTRVKDNYSGHYDTFENEKLIHLNENLFKQLNLTFNANTPYAKETFELITNSYSVLDKNEHQKFIAHCDSNSPWIWKDPRLRVTLGFWLELIQTHDLKFILVTREPWSLWVSLLNKRQIVVLETVKRFELETRELLRSYAKGKNIPLCTINFDKLISKPEPQIEKINQFLGVDLSREDYNNVANLALVKESRSYIRQVKALLIFIKNYF
ncbi:sulfotransferase [Thalassotalea psychrophila]|uniref:Sulfotransferase n=1 Tax=Thalassotalea psychrophila TaxID=3065647 RepID=A0ABY9TVK8_9GAMM|nr:sulfotransferase [Colwelliaceae bacterium SQ149]